MAAAPRVSCVRGCFTGMLGLRAGGAPQCLLSSIVGQSSVTTSEMGTLIDLKNASYLIGILTITERKLLEDLTILLYKCSFCYLGLESLSANFEAHQSEKPRQKIRQTSVIYHWPQASVNHHK